MANPDVALAFQNPRVQAAIMDVSQKDKLPHRLHLPLPFSSHSPQRITVLVNLQCSQNPFSIAKYQNDKEVRISIPQLSSFIYTQNITFSPYL